MKEKKPELARQPVATKEKPQAKKATPRLTEKIAVKKKARKDYMAWHLAVFVILLILLLIGLFVFRDLSLKVYEQRQELALVKAQNERLYQLPGELQSWEEEINHLEKFFPGEEEMISFFNFLEKIFPSENFNFNFKNYQAAIDSQGRPFLRFSLTGEGDWQNEIAPFLDSFFEGPYFIFPERLYLESTESVFRTAKMGVTGRVYVDYDFLERGLR